jgi:hypothetical protein
MLIINRRLPKSISAVSILAAALSVPAFAQAPYPQQPPPYDDQAPPPPAFPTAELENLVSRIALYPDPLLAQVLAAATYSDQIPDAAGWADQHRYLTGDNLAAAINAGPASVRP